jgi:serine/threonine protein kinase
LQNKDFANFVIPASALSNPVVIGEGSFGVVERAELDGTEVAVKRLRSDRVSEKDIKSFQDEAFIMR